MLSGRRCRNVACCAPPPPATLDQRPKLMPDSVAMRTYAEHKQFYDKLQMDIAKNAGRAVVDPDVALSQVANSGRLASGRESRNGGGVNSAPWVA